MAKFIYTAAKDGKKITGTIEAGNKDGALATLEHQGIRPLSLNEIHDKRTLEFSFGARVKIKDLVVFSRQLSTMISAGVPLNRSLATLREQTDNKYFKEVISKVGKDVEGGKSFADALAMHPKAFNDIFVNMVRAGEAGGILEEILKKLASQIEKDASMRKKIKGAMAYPTVIFGITIIAFFGIMIFVMPKIGAIIKDLGGPDTELPIYTQIMLDISSFMQNNAILIIVIFAGVVFAIKKYISTEKGKYNFHMILLNTPILKTIIAKVALARFARTFASLMGAGVSVIDSLHVTAKAIGNKVIEKELMDAAKEVKFGHQLSEPLSKSPYFPTIVSQMLTIGEETGQIDTILVKVADFYEEEVDVVIDGLSALIEPLMIVVLGAMVGLIAASVMGPIASLSENIG
jgi:type IV pilus assembly protein PilC